MNHMDFRQALVTIQTEYVEMPGLKLTLWQATRLWNLPIELWQAALGALVMAGFLVERLDRVYQRRGTPPVQVAALDSLTWAVRPGPVANAA